MIVMTAKEYIIYLFRHNTMQQLTEKYGVGREEFAIDLARAGKQWGAWFEVAYNEYLANEDYACKCSCTMGGVCDSIGCNCANCPIH